MTDKLPRTPDRNYPALFLALDEVLEALGDGRPDEDALRYARALGRAMAGPRPTRAAAPPDEGER